MTIRLLLLSLLVSIFVVPVVAQSFPDKNPLLNPDWTAWSFAPTFCRCLRMCSRRSATLIRSCPCDSRWRRAMRLVTSFGVIVSFVIVQTPI